MDVDSTLIQDEVIELLAEHAGRAAEVAAVTEARDARRARLRPEPARPGRHAGRPARVGARRGPRCRAPHPGRPHPGAHPQAPGFTVASCRAASSRSSSRSPLELGIDYVAGQPARGRRRPAHRPVIGEVVDRAGKATALREFAALEGLPMEPDRRDRRRRQRPRHARGRRARIAFNAKPIVRRPADTSLNVPYLDAILYLLGISREEIEDTDDDDHRATRLTRCRDTPRPPPRCSSSVGRRTGSAGLAPAPQFVKPVRRPPRQARADPTASSFQDEVVDLDTEESLPGRRAPAPRSSTRAPGPNCTTELAGQVDDATGAPRGRREPAALGALLPDSVGQALHRAHERGAVVGGHLGRRLDHEPTS